MQPYQTKPGFLYIPIKRGDGIISKNAAPQVRMFNGMCSGYIDPEKWQTPPSISVFSQGETQWIEVPKTKESLEFAKEAGRLSAYDRSNKNFRQAELLIDPVSLQPHSQNRDFIFDFYTHKKPVPVLCLKSLPLNSIKESSRININDKPIEDVGQIQEGSFIVGGAPEDNYPLLGGAGGSFAALGNLTDNLYFYQSSTITETAQSTTAISLNNHRLTVRPLSYLFVFNNSLCILSDLGAGDLFYPGPDGPGNIEFLNLSVKAISALTSIFRPHVPVGADFNTYISRCFVNGNALTQINFILESTGANVIRRNLIYAASGEGIRLGADSNTILNNTILDCPTGMSLLDKAAIVRNNYVADSTVACITDKVGATGLFNATSDATGQGAWDVELGNLINKASADCISLTESSYGDIIRGGPLDSAGQNTSILSPCIKGRFSPVPGTSTPSIGAAELSIKPRSDWRYW